MSDYIDKSYLIKAFSTFRDTKNGNIHFLYGIRSAVEIVENAPTTDVVPVVYGEWMENENFNDGFWTCSACGFVSEAGAAPYLYRYCPHCGAKMQAEG